MSDCDNCVINLLGLSHGDANSSPKDSRAQMHSSTSIDTPFPEKVTLYRNIIDYVL